MDAAANIPPELFGNILFYVGADLNIHGGEISFWRTAIRHLTTCSIVCVYWANICRPRIFERVWIKNLDSFRQFLHLVSRTPSGFTPISHCVRNTNLIQHVEDRPWIHLLQLQPSFLRPLQPATICFTLDGSSRRPINNSQSQHDASTTPSPRFFAGIPRSLPPSCYRCHTLTIKNLHFDSMHSFKQLLRRFTFRTLHGFVWPSLDLINISWGGQLVAPDAWHGNAPLNITIHPVTISAFGSPNNAETAWLAYSCAVRSLVCEGTSPGDGWPISSIVCLHSSDQQIIRDTGKLMEAGVLSEGRLNTLSFKIWNMNVDQRPYILGHKAYRPKAVCSMIIDGRSPTEDIRTCGVIFRFYACQEVTGFLEELEWSGIDHIGSIRIVIGPFWDLASAGIDGAIAYRRDKFVDLWMDLPKLLRVQFLFYSREDLSRFMEVRRVDLIRLWGRIGLFLRMGSFEMQGVDFETLRGVDTIPDENVLA